MTACGEASPLVYHLKGSPDLSTSQNCMENPENFDASRYTVFMNFSDVDLDVSNMKTPLQRNITAGPLANFTVGCRIMLFGGQSSLRAVFRAGCW